MLKRTTALLFSSVVLLILSVPGVLHAQDEAEMTEPASSEPASEPIAAELPPDPNAARHGVGLRLRYIFVPQGLIEVFMEEAPSGVSQSGFGLDYVHRKKDFEISVGFEYDTLSPEDGYFIEAGGAATKPGTTDFIEFDGLSWFTIDASFVYHKKLSSLVSLRYGGGIGIGIVRGEILQTDAVCTGPDAQSDCIKSGQAGGQLNEKADFWRFPPVFNVLGGVQFTPARNIAINLELGMRTVFYTGVGAQYFF